MSEYDKDMMIEIGKELDVKVLLMNMMSSNYQLDYYSTSNYKWKEK